MITRSGKYRTVKEVGKVPAFNVELKLCLGDGDDIKHINIGIMDEAQLDRWFILIDAYNELRTEDIADIEALPGYGEFFYLDGSKEYSKPQWSTDNYELSIPYWLERMTITTTIEGIVYEIDRA